MRQIAPNNRKRNINWRPADPREARWPRSRQGLLPSSPSPLLTVQTFLYPDKTIKPNSTERSLGNSLQKEREGCCQKSRKRRWLLRAPRPPCSTLSSTRKVEQQGWMHGHIAHLPAQPFQNSTAASSLLHHTGHCSKKRNIPLDLFHYFTSRVKLVISHDRGWIWLATKHHFTLDLKFYQPWKWCIPEGRVVSNGCVDMCIPPPIHCSTTKNQNLLPPSTCT